jgi:hypothetical protein
MNAQIAAALALAILLAVPGALAETDGESQPPADSSPEAEQGCDFIQMEPTFPFVSTHLECIGQDG